MEKVSEHVGLLGANTLFYGCKTLTNNAALVQLPKCICDVCRGMSEVIQCLQVVCQIVIVLIVQCHFLNNFGLSYVCNEKKNLT